MVKLLTIDRDSVTLVENKPVLRQVSINYYNPLYKCFTNIRTVRLRRTYPEIEMKLYLLKHPELNIYTITSHNPILTAADDEEIAQKKTTMSKIMDRQRICIGGEYYIDEFGRYVYIASRVGTQQDIDLRYDGVSESELFDLQYVEDDISNRNPHRVDRKLYSG